MKKNKWIKGMSRLMISSMLIVFLVCSNFFEVFAEEEVNIDYGDSQTIELPIEATYWQSEARRQLAMVNAFRAEEGVWYWNEDDESKTYFNKTGCVQLGELTYDYDLEKVAMKRAFESAVLWDHLRPNGAEWYTAYTELNYPSKSISENLATGYGYVMDAESAMDVWKETNRDYSGQGHRRTMLGSKFKAIGCACVIYHNRYYWVQEFNSTVSSNVETEANDSSSIDTVSIKKEYIDSWKQIINDYTVDTGDTVDISDAITLKFRTAIFDDINGNKDSYSYNMGYRPVSYEYAYESTDTDIATVDSEGIVTGVSNGDVDITVKSKDGVYTSTVKVTVRAITGYSVLPVITVASGTSPEAQLPATVTATWSDNTTSVETIDWGAIPNDYKSRAATTFEIYGTIAGFSGNVVQQVSVTRASISSITRPEAVSTDSGVEAVLPEKVNVTWSNGDKTEESVTWAKQLKSDFTQTSGGQYTVSGTVAEWEKTKTTNITVNVNPAKFSGYDPLSDISTTVGISPNLPEAALIEWSDGERSSEDITWNMDEINSYDKPGEYTAKGVVYDFNGTPHEVSIKLTILPRKLIEISWKEGSPTNVTSYYSYDLSRIEGILIAKYNNGTTKEIELPDELNSIDVDNFDMTSKDSTQDVVIKYSENYLDTTITAELKDVTLCLVKKESLSIKKLPKTDYIEGQNLDISGIELEWILDNKEKVAVKENEFDINNFTGYIKNPENYGSQTITIEIEGIKKTYEINVRQKKITGLHINRIMDKLDYVVGQDVDFSGLQVDKVYDNGDYEPISNDSLELRINCTQTSAGEIWSPNNTGEYQLFVSYIEGQYLYWASRSSFKVNVYERELQSIEINTKPIVISIPQNNKDYSKSIFDDGILTAHYNCGYDEKVPFSDEHVLIDLDITEVGQKTATVTYNGKETSFDVDITEPKVVETFVTSPTKTGYAQGEALNLDGAAIVFRYDNGDETSIPVTTDDNDISVSFDGGESTTGGLSDGSKTLVVKYKGSKLLKEDGSDITINVAKREGIRIKNNPTKVSYPVGTELKDLDLSGLVLEAYFDDNTSSEIPAADYKLGTNNEYDSSVLGTKTITVEAYGLETTFEITIREKRLTSLVIENGPDKTEYIPGQSVVISGLNVKGLYDNNTEEEVNVSINNICVGITSSNPAGQRFNTSSIGTFNPCVVISEEYDGSTHYTYSDTFEIKVVNKEVQSIEITTPPATLNIPLNWTGFEEYNFSDGQIKAYCNCGYEETVSFSNSAVSVSGLIKSTLGEYTITVKYGGKTTTFVAKVIEPTLTSKTVTPPTKTSYTEGEAISLEGAAVVKTYDNGLSETIDLSQDAAALEAEGIKVVFVDAAGKEYAVNDSSVTTTTGAKTLVVKYKTSADGDPEQWEELKMPGGTAVSVNVQQKQTNPSGGGNGSGSDGNSGSGNGTGGKGSGNGNTGSGGNAAGGTGAGNGTGNGSGGAKKNTLVTTSKGTQYIKADGSYAKSEWVTVNGTKYYFNADSYNASNEWRDGKWISADGSCTYSGQLIWKSNSSGWWVEDTVGWYPQNSWQKIDGVWYYFNSSGYMASGEWYDGYWFNSDGSWDPTYKLTWKGNSSGWWIEDISGWWPSSCWQKIDGSWYYFDGSGYMVTNQYVDGYWIGSDGVCN